MDIKTTQHGVIIGRFQTPKLENILVEEHKKLFKKYVKIKNN